MIRIKDYIFNENYIKRIILVNNKKLIIKFSDEDTKIIDNTTLEDIEWNYDGKIISLENRFKEIKELEEKNEKLKKESKQLRVLNVCVCCNERNLEDRINKAIEYINNNDLYYQEEMYDYEENLELGNPDDSEAKKDLLKILKGEE